MGLQIQELKIPLIDAHPLHLQELHERIRPYDLPETEALAHKLEERLATTNKLSLFSDELYSIYPSLHQKRLEQIQFVKQQIILTELVSELNWIETNLEKIQALQELQPEARLLFSQRITELKERIKQKIGPTSLLP
jgi:hypothetical protein